ncbi:hypothetical protein GGR50DRAFT_655619 [Xylaria sp. CBS 124048]|nr:hypothetical protein GGR50DRAFT_655619 [Xylaria sp. CBS 124048]
MDSQVPPDTNSWHRQPLFHAAQQSLRAQESSGPNNKAPNVEEVQAGYSTKSSRRNSTPSLTWTESHMMHVYKYLPDFNASPRPDTGLKESHIPPIGPDEKRWSHSDTGSKEHEHEHEHSTLDALKADLERMRNAQKETARQIIYQKDTIDQLERIVKGKDELVTKLGGKLFDQFVTMTKCQQYELNKLQLWLMDIQTAAETWSLRYEWLGLQHSLDRLNCTLDGYIRTIDREKINAGNQSDELTLYMRCLLADVPRLWSLARKLEQMIAKEKARATEQVGQDSEPEPKDTAEDVCRDDFYKLCTDLWKKCEKSHWPLSWQIIDTYYKFARRHRQRTAKRRDRLYELLDQTSTELSRLRDDWKHEQGRTANMATRMRLWANDTDDLEPLRLSPAQFMDSLGKKLSVLERGSEELERITGVIEKLPSDLYCIDVQILEKGRPGIDTI